MCSEADPTQVALRDAQAAFTRTIDSSFKTTFANQQQILGFLSAKLQQMIAHPSGFTPAELTALRTGATDTTAAATANAQKAVAAYGASHGGADLGSGVQAQIQGAVATSGAQELSREKSQITIADAERQQENYWSAINGLTGVGRAYDPTGYASAETSSANATTAASHEVSAEKQTGWQNAFGVVSGVAGLASAATGGISDIITAQHS